MTTDLSQDALEKAAIAAREAMLLAWPPWSGLDERMRESWTAVARAAITTYKAATDPIVWICPSCHEFLHWLLKEDPPAEVECSCGAMVSTGWSP